MNDERIYSEIDAERAKLEPLWPHGHDAMAIRTTIQEIAAVPEDEPRGIRFQLRMIAALAVAGIIAADRQAAEEATG